MEKEMVAFFVGYYDFFGRKWISQAKEDRD